MVTIFSTPRPFVGPFYNIQLNAIKSWLELGDQTEVILFEDEEKTTSKIAEELGILCIKDVNRDEFATPLLDSVFEKVKSISKNSIICQVNSDIILTSSFLAGIKLAKDILQDKIFFMTGRRWDLDVNEAVNFQDVNWQKKIIEKAKKEGKMHGFSGMDYWVIPSNLPFKIPPFVIGRPGMDSWLVYKSRSFKMPVIDSTAVVDIIHQNHNYPKKKNPFFEVEKKRNIKLAGGFSNMCTLRDANWILTSKGLKRPSFPRIVISQLTLFYPWRMILSFKRKLFS